MSAGEAAVRRARSAVGARFRPQGRDIATGLDCVGVVAIAWGLEGQAVPSGYAMRSSATARAGAALDAVAQAVAGAPMPGDALLLEAGPGQLHLAIWTGSGTIHADAMLRRVVERPGDPPFAMVGAWRPREV